MLEKILSASGYKSYRILWIKLDDFAAFYAKGIPVCFLVMYIISHPTTGYLENRCYRELRSYLSHTE
jgi:hypothetical protein